jgi:murein DD-endopeptidase MepM/ murein hydrolase activator NlpD
LGAAPAFFSASAAAQGTQGTGPQFGLPMGLPGQLPGDGCYIRHGYACENTGFNTGWWHTGENWYLTEGNSAGAEIYAVAGGTVVYADADYPGRVVIVEHASGIYSMYGHLDYDLSVAAGDVVERGQLLGTVLFRTDTRSPSHLHFELRTFFTTPEVNGATPRYSYPCGVQCPPGPGYWPMGDPDHPSTLGWLNPMHVIASRSYPDGVPSGTMAIVASDLMTHTTPIWSEPIERAEPLDQMILIPGQQFPLIAISVGDEASVETSANAYQVWYEIEGPDEVRGWVRAMQPSAETTQVDGRPAAVRIDFLVGTSQD